jgi:hypothetical protein
MREYRYHHVPLSVEELCWKCATMDGLVPYGDPVATAPGSVFVLGISR